MKRSEIRRAGGLHKKKEGSNPLLPSGKIFVASGAVINAHLFDQLAEVGREGAQQFRTHALFERKRTSFAIPTKAAGPVVAWRVRSTQARI